MPAVFDQRYVKRLDGPNVKKGKNKRDLADQVVADIRAFKAKHGCDRLVMIWTGSTEVFMTQTAAHAIAGGVRTGARAERRCDPVEHGLRVRRDPRGNSVRERGAEPDRRHSGHAGAGRADEARRSPATT